MLRHLGIVHHVARAWVADPCLAEDLVQGAFLRAHRIFDRFELGTNFKGWILKILRYEYLDRARKAGRQPAVAFLDDLPESAAVAPDDPAPRSLDLDSREVFYDLFGDEIAGLLRRLPERARLVVLLSDVEGLSYREIAEAVGCPVGTVRSTLHRTRLLLQELLSDYARQTGFLRGNAP